MPSIKVLAISPYPGMVPLLTETAKEYDGLELTISVGDLAKGLELAQKGFHANFDVIISRGGTARLLKQSVSLPVIEIGTTVYDVLCTLQRANIHEGRVAIVGYSNITQDMGILRTLLPYQLDVFTIQSSSQAVTTLQYLRREEYASVLCDMVTYTAAKEMDVNAFLITSSAESIRAAFDQAVFFCSANRQLRSENQFLRQLLHKRTSQTVVFTRAGKLVFSTLEDASAELLDMLREKIESVAAAGRIKVMQQFRGLLYNIEAMQLPSDGEAYTAFYFLASTPPLLPGTNTASATITAANWRRRAPPVSITSPASPPNIIKASCRRRQDAHRCFCSAPPEQGRNIWRARSTCAARVAATLLFRSTVTC